MAADCSSKNLQKVPGFSTGPRITTLDLHNNSIQQIPRAIFSNVSSSLENLDLSFNLIEVLNIGAFSQLVNLKILKLGHNRLCLHSAYPEGLFKDLRSLHTLYTLGNKCLPRHETYPDQTFKDLISLEQLSLDVADDFQFKSGFRELRKLQYLEATGYECNGVVISNKSFHNFADIPISNLVLRGCVYKSIEPGSLVYFKNLSQINLACTEKLNFTSVTSALKAMPGDTVETIIFDGMKMEENANFCYKNFNNVKRMSIRATGISKIRMQNGPNMFCLDRLEHLNLGANTPPMIFNDYMPKGSEQHGQKLFPLIVKYGHPKSFYWSGNPIQIVDASKMFAQPYYVSNTYCKLMEQDFEGYFQTTHNKYVQPPFENSAYTTQYVWPMGMRYVVNQSEFYGIDDASIFHFTPSPTINVVYVNDNFASAFWDLNLLNGCPHVFYPPNGVVYFNISNNNIKTLVCPFVGMKNLRVFDCSRCKLDHIHEEFFTSKYLQNLEILHLQENNLGKIGKLSILFKDAKTLKEVNLARNNIKALPMDTFENMKELEIVDLSNNLLLSIDLRISHLTKLKQLGFSNNQLVSIHQHFRTELEKVNLNDSNISVSITGNQFRCSCGNVRFLTWIQNTRINVLEKGDLLCHDKSSKLINVNTDDLNKTCDKMKQLDVDVSPPAFVWKP